MSTRSTGRARPIFVGGTSSNAGKSWTATALCAWLRRKGVAVAPFKAQNMSNHSFPCRGGGEIGRAQVAQAEACGLLPEPAMNPILLKPNGNGTSQVIVNGQLWRTLSAREYYACFDGLLREVLAAYEALARRFEVIVLEGAGSVSELNLAGHDLVNLGLVTRLDAPWFLVADIERGGVFASIVGTVALLSARERALFRGFLINKFRGDRALFTDGVRTLETRTAAPCLGVCPYLEGVSLDAEDSLALDLRPTRPAPGGARVAIVRFPALSNATDFRLLRWADWIVRPPAGAYDVVILPGTKQTIADLAWLRETGLAEWVTAHARTGGRLVGVCGGFQMLGRAIHDAHAIESPHVHGVGLALLPVETTLATEKTTRVVTAAFGAVRFASYEIHLGRTTIDPGYEPFATVDDGGPEGVRHGAVMGTYLHGAFEDPAVCADVLGLPIDMFDRTDKSAHYEALADWLETYGTLEPLGL